MRHPHLTRWVATGFAVAFGVLAWVSLRSTGRLPAWRPPAAAPVALPVVTGGPPALHAWFDFPVEEPRVHGLSGLAWEAGAPCGFALPDDRAALVELCADPTVTTFRVAGERPLHAAGSLDGEGLARVPGGWLVADEDAPRVLHFRDDGTADAEVWLPVTFSKGRRNRSLESVSFSSDGPCVVAASEVALRPDGPPATLKHGTRARLARMRVAEGRTESFLYETEPAPWEGADQGVTDVLALSASRLLVLERAWGEGRGNVVRLFLADLSRTTREARPEPAFPLVARVLLLDLATLPRDGAPAPRQPQPHPLLANYEALSFGPRLPDGRATLLLVSDDNSRPEQAARVLVLALPP